MTDDKLLKIKRKAAELKKLYQEDPRQESFNLLLCGETGTGKTQLLKTCPQPIHIDSFDPGGTKHLRDEIDQGIIIPAIYEGDDPMKPSKFKQWEKDMQERVRSGYFDYMGTYALDSSTTWASAIMNKVLADDGVPGIAPRFTKDYTPQKTKIMNWLKVILNIPCCVVVTGHLEASKDEVEGTVSYRYMTTGKAEVLIPLEFDEVWVTDTKKSAKGLQYRVVTARTGPYLATTRIGRGKFETYEEPDVMKLLKKAGFPAKHKPLLV